MTTDLDDSLLQDLARPVVTQFSPAEDGELFLLLSEAPELIRHPLRRLTPAAPTW